MKMKPGVVSGAGLEAACSPGSKAVESSRSVLSRMTRPQVTLEIELGVTGGEEDGVDSSEIDNAKLYTQPEGVQGMTARLVQACKDLGSLGKFY